MNTGSQVVLNTITLYLKNPRLRDGGKFSVWLQSATARPEAAY